MTHDEILETTKVYSALGQAETGLIEDRPFRSPHHTISTAGLLGGGTMPRPGEISMAHNGVLFLDELPEFARGAIESLRQPLEDRVVTIGRVAGTVKLPASFLLAASANPCPCGWLDSGVRQCTCSGVAIERYRSRMSGPLLDRIDLRIFVRAVALTDLRAAGSSESSAQVRDRVAAARARQLARLAPWGIRTNAEMNTVAQRATCRLDSKAEAVLTSLVKANRTLTARSIDRIIRVARTIADLAGAEHIDDGCLHEAASYRAMDGSQ
jgi:magnesium chelatase family protein